MWIKTVDGSLLNLAQCWLIDIVPDVVGVDRRLEHQIVAFHGDKPYILFQGDKQEAEAFLSALARKLDAVHKYRYEDGKFRLCWDKC